MLICKVCGTANLSKGAPICCNCGAQLVVDTPQKAPQEETKSVEAASPAHDMVLVEGGDMTLGSDDVDGNPVHEVTLSSFYMSKFAVTQKLYEKTTGSNPSDRTGDNKPVECVSWYEAVEFCNKLSREEGLPSCYKIDKENQDSSNWNDEDDKKWTVTCDFHANGYRLPTKAEWEYAARGGQKSKGYLYAGSDNLDQVGWYDDGTVDIMDAEPQAVGQKAPNELGLYDMCGNVDEWCWDWADGETEGGKNPTGPKKGQFRSYKGGNNTSDPEDCAVAECCGNSPHEGSQDLGFRLVRSAI